MKILLAKWVSDRCTGERLFTLTLVNREVLISSTNAGYTYQYFGVLEMLSLNYYLTIAA